MFVGSWRGERDDVFGTDKCKHLRRARELAQVIFGGISGEHLAAYAGRVIHGAVPALALRITGYGAVHASCRAVAGDLRLAHRLQRETPLLRTPAPMISARTPIQ